MYLCTIKLVKKGKNYGDKNNEKGCGCYGHVIRRVEKILMPNGRYRYPVTYIDKTPGFWLGSVIEESERKAKELDVDFRP